MKPTTYIPILVVGVTFAVAVVVFGYIFYRYLSSYGDFEEAWKQAAQELGAYFQLGQGLEYTYIKGEHDGVSFLLEFRHERPYPSTLLQIPVQGTQNLRIASRSWLSRLLHLWETDPFRRDYVCRPESVCSPVALDRELADMIGQLGKIEIWTRDRTLKLRRPGLVKDPQDVVLFVKTGIRLAKTVGNIPANKQDALQ